MATAFYRWLQIGLYVTKLLNEVAKRVKESTPEEKAQIVKHVVAIYDVLKAATQRESPNANGPMLMLAPSAPQDSVRQKQGARKRHQRWDERAFSAQVAEWPIAVAGETGASVARADHSDRMRNALIAFRRTFRRYKHHLNNANRKEIMEHARELAHVIAEIEKRTRARRRGQI